jgi:predicted nucleotidyltransferase component of viral defense system
LDLRPSIIEKVGRISDVLVGIGQDPLLRDTLCLYGGTALNFLHFPETPRLSEDLDFNYRHKSERDWGDVRSEVDERIKEILRTHGYDDDQVRIQPKYNIGRFHVKYKTAEALKDTFKVEIGYTRRIPILREDEPLVFHHPIGETSVPILTPSREEIFANKFSTMLARKGRGMYLRDVFDVAIMSELDVDLSLMVDVVLVESLMCEFDPSNIRFRPMTVEQMDTLQPMVGFSVDLEEIRDRALDYYNTVIGLCQEREWVVFTDRFWSSGSIDHEMFENPDRINPDIEAHPLLRWLREKRARRES